MSEPSRTWCGLFRCCREANHEGTCEIDHLDLTQAQLDAIDASGEAA